MKKALIITGKFAQDPEFIYPYYRLLEEGFEVVSATEDGKEVVGVNGNKIIVNATIEGQKADDYEMLVIPGGARAMEYIRQNQAALDLIAEFDAKKKPIACICHGAQLLISAKIVKGRKVSGYYSLKDDIINAGAEYVDEPAVVDGNLVTTAHYKHMGPWMKAALALLKK